jgi:leucyl/phenylalanyl-tRNA--protein transferase
MTAAPLYWIGSGSLSQTFPDPATALRDPDGLLAIGGDLGVERLLDAYRRGIFPWYSAGQPILWWAPDPRIVLLPDAIHVSRSLRRTLAKRTYDCTIDRSFARVIRHCAAPRRDAGGTWLTEDMIDAYENLHRAGYAHSVETWHAGELTGGLYGIAIGRVFFGESMFARRADASKVALVHLAGKLHEWGYRLIDCQVDNPHLRSLGANPLPRAEFNALLAELGRESPRTDAWNTADD